MLCPESEIIYLKGEEHEWTRVMIGNNNCHCFFVQLLCIASPFKDVPLFGS